MEQEEEDLVKTNKDLAFIQEIASSMPGIDEAMSFAEVLR